MNDKQTNQTEVRTEESRLTWRDVNLMSDEQYRLYWIERVRARCITTAEGCWHWTGRVATNGYGQTTYRGKHSNVVLSRKMFEVWNQVTLDRLEYVCHTCDNKRCCNPAHLWKGNNGLNKKDETAKRKNYWANRTHCPKGHEYTPENTRMHESRPGVVSRGCKACERERHSSPEYVAWRREYQRRKRAEQKQQRSAA